MRPHAVQIVAIEQVVERALIQFDRVGVAEPVRPVKALRLEAFVEKPVAVQMPDQDLHTLATARNEDPRAAIGRVGTELGTDQLGESMAGRREWSPTPAPNRTRRADFPQRAPRNTVHFQGYTQACTTFGVGKTNHGFTDNTFHRTVR